MCEHLLLQRAGAPLLWRETEGWAYSAWKRERRLFQGLPAGVGTRWSSSSFPTQTILQLYDWFYKFHCCLGIECSHGSAQPCLCPHQGAYLTLQSSLRGAHWTCGIAQCLWMFQGQGIMSLPGKLPQTCISVFGHGGVIFSHQFSQKIWWHAVIWLYKAMSNCTEISFLLHFLL